VKTLVAPCVKCGEALPDDPGYTVADVTEAWLEFGSDQDDARICTPCAREYGEAG
jgi:hypothetical protein